jgi:hypothetical protein
MVLAKMSEDPSFGDDQDSYNHIWYEISKKETPNAVALLIQNHTKLYRTIFSLNESDEAAAFLIEHSEYMDTECITFNRNPIIARWFREGMASTVTHTIWRWTETRRAGEPADRIRTANNTQSRLITEKDTILMHYDVDGFSCIESDEAMRLLEENPDVICWDLLSANPHPRAIALLEKNLDKVVWKNASANLGAATLLAAHLDKVCWSKMSTNAGAIEILLSNIHRISWHEFSRNTHPSAISLISPPNPMAEATPKPRRKLYRAVRKIPPTRIVWSDMSENPAPEAVALMAANLDKVHWDRLCFNFNSDALDLIAANVLGPDAPYAHLLKNSTDDSRRINKCVLSKYATPKIILAIRQDQLCWKGLSENPHPEAMALLEAHPENIDWTAFSKNPGIFEAEYDYAAMRAAMDVLREDLVKAAFHPRRLARHLALGGEIEDF